MHIDVTQPELGTIVRMMRSTIMVIATTTEGMPADMLMKRNAELALARKLVDRLQWKDTNICQICRHTVEEHDKDSNCPIWV
jgi:rubrerythrin